jgi:hypothetical protein
MSLVGTGVKEPIERLPQVVRPLFSYFTLSRSREPLDEDLADPAAFAIQTDGIPRGRIAHQLHHVTATDTIDARLKLDKDMQAIHALTYVFVSDVEMLRC